MMTKKESLLLKVVEDLSTKDTENAEVFNAFYHLSFSL